MDRKRGIDWLELAVFGTVGAALSVLVLVFPNLVRYAMGFGLGAFLIVNAFLGVKQKRFPLAIALLSAAVFAFAPHSPVGLALAYVAVFSIILRRAIRADAAANAAPAYILFGHEESRYNRSGFRSRM